MKKTFQLLAIVAICSAMMVSCKNTKNTEPTSEEIQAQKVALADSVLTKIDAFADEYFVASGNRFIILKFELTEEEKMVKPDYLLDPSEANKFVTKSQKVNALAIYAMELGVREIYGMPTEGAKEAITKLIAEVNYPFDPSQRGADIPLSEVIKSQYEKCKERGELAYFWQFQNALICEMNYIVAQNPELFFSKITEEQWQGFRYSIHSKQTALVELAQYDDEVANILQPVGNFFPYSSKEEMLEANKTKDSAKQFRLANKDKFVALRNALLQ